MPISIILLSIKLQGCRSLIISGMQVQVLLDPPIESFMVGIALSVFTVLHYLKHLGGDPRAELACSLDALFAFAVVFRTCSADCGFNATRLIARSVHGCAKAGLGWKSRRTDIYDPAEGPRQFLSSGGDYPARTVVLDHIAKNVSARWWDV
jgi:hypothetical protein